MSESGLKGWIELQRTHAKSAPRAGGSFRAVGSLVTGTVLGQGLTLLVAPILSRAYTPADFALLAIYGSTVAVLIAIVTLRYELAIPLPEHDSDAITLAQLAIIVATGMVIVLVAVTNSWKVAISDAMGAPGLARFYWFVWAGVLAGAYYSALSYWSIRKGLFNALAKTRAIQGVGQSAIQVAGAILSAGAPGLILGDFVGRAAGTSKLLSHFRPRERVRLFRPRSTALLRQAKRYRRFPQLMTLATVLNVLSLQAPIFVLARHFDADVLGFYALTFRVLALPASVIGQAIGQVLLARLSRLRASPVELSLASVRATVVLFALALPPFALLGSAGTSLFSLAFGSQWAASGLYAQLLAPWFLFWFVSSPLSSLLLVREWQGSSLAFTAVELVVRVTSLVVGVRAGSILLALALLSISGVLISVVSIGRFLRAGHAPLRSTAFRLIRASVLCLPLLAASSYLNVAYPANVGLIVSAVSLGGCYLLLFRYMPELRPKG